MRLIGTVAVAAGVTNALTLLTPRDAPRVVQHDIQRAQVQRPSSDAERLRARAGTISASLSNQKTLYLMKTYIGTPAQTLNLHIDTGSSDLWVNSPNNGLCTSRGNQCSISGTYSANSSSSYSYVNSLFNITYADGSGATGDYASDTVSFGGANLTSQEFGIGYYSSSAEGILGIGYTTNEAILRYDGGRTYTNVPANLVQSGYINTNAYSLWLNDLQASTGSILFGGVDTDKFSGTLQTLPVLKLNGYYSAFYIAMTALGANGNTGSIASNQAIAVLLDSGSSLMYLPDSMASTVYNMFGAQYSQNEGLAVIDCSQQQNSTTLDFTFSGVTIKVPLSEMVLVAGYNGRQNVCILGISPAGGSTAVLGDTFLRSAYVVYDIANNEISLAQTNFDSSSSNILEITNSGVPSATAVQNPVTSATNAAGGIGNINGGTITITATAGAATAPAVYGAAVAGAVGAGLMAML